MAKLIYLFLLITYVVFAQEIGNSSFTDENVENQLHHREKRLVNSLLNGRRFKVPYIVYILKNRQYHCIGIILTPEMILTSAKCIYEDNVAYAVLAARVENGESATYRVTHKYVYEYFDPRSQENDVGLLVIYPAIVEQNFVHKIQLHNETLLANSVAILTGWGSSKPVLRSVFLEIIGHELCRNAYGSFRVITARHICAIGSDRYGKGLLGDSGGPLIVNGELVGIYSWTGVRQHQENPDVFVNLQYPLYLAWIRQVLRQHHSERDFN